MENSTKSLYQQTTSVKDKINVKFIDGKYITEFKFFYSITNIEFLVCYDKENDRIEITVLKRKNLYFLIWGRVISQKYFE